MPFSTLGWENPEWIEQGYATGAAEGLTVADLPDHAYWEEWFPADWVSEMREQIRLWFYSQLFMSVALTGRAPYRKVLGYEKMLDETGREMHGSWGNMIDAAEAFARMGADVMRWQYCAQPPNQNLLFGFGPGQEIQRKLLTLWNSAAFFVQYANIAGFTPDARRSRRRVRPSDAHGARPLARGTHPPAASPRPPTGYEQYLTVNVLRAFEAFVDDLSNWYVRRSRRRFWDGDEAALRTLWSALVDALRVVVAGHAVPHRAPLAGPRRSTPCRTRPRRSSWPAGRRCADPTTSAARRGRRRAPGRRARPPGAGRRQAAHAPAPAPPRRRGARPSRGPRRRDRRRAAGQGGGVRAGRGHRARVRPNLPVLGPRLGAELGKLREALDAGEFEELPDGGLPRCGPRPRGPTTCSSSAREKEGWAVAAADGATVALDSTLDDDLRLEGRVYDTIHHVNTLRKEQGLALTDRIDLAPARRRTPTCWRTPTGSARRPSPSA